MSSVRPQVLVVSDVLPGMEPGEPHLGMSGPLIRFTTDPQQACRMLEDKPFDVLVVDASHSNGESLKLLRLARSLRPGCRLVMMDNMQLDKRITQAFSVGVREYLRKPCTSVELLDSITRAMSAAACPPLPAGPEGSFASLEAIRALSCAVEAKDPYTFRHSEHVCRYAEAIARRLHLSEEEVRSVSVAALVHDVGKIGVPDHILTKPGRLTEEEFGIVRRHPAIGEGIVRNLSAFTAEAEIVRGHHENWDGSGYPDGLREEDIPLGSRIIRVADAMDAMLMQRSYKAPYPLEAMTTELLRCAGSDFEPRLAACAVTWCRKHADRVVTAAGWNGEAPAGFSAGLRLSEEAEGL